LLARLASPNDCIPIADDLVYVGSGFIALAIAGTKLVEHDFEFKRTDHYYSDVCADCAVSNYGYKRRTRFVALILIGLSALNVLATSNTESGENSELVITIPVLAAGVLFLIASFVDKQDDSAEEK